jgi:F-type H+-transporting ATPase subunit h
MYSMLFAHVIRLSSLRRCLGDPAHLHRPRTAPTPPKAPALPSDLAGELAKFDATEPVIGATEAKETPIAEEGEGADEYLTFLEKDLPKAAAHH